MKRTGRPRAPREMRGVIVVVLDHDVSALAISRAQALRHLVENVGNAVVTDRVHSVETKPVEMKLLDPIFGILDKEVADPPGVWPVEIDRFAPGGTDARIKEIRRVERKVISVRPEVIVNDVEQHRDAGLMGSIDESLEIVGPPVAGIRRIRQDSIVTPAPAARKVAERHDLHGRYAELNEVRQFGRRCGEGPFRRKGADMQFVKDGVFPIQTAPVGPPAKDGGIDQLADPMGVLGLETRCGVRDKGAAIQRKSIARAICEVRDP